jgi:hypothetical protein
MIGSLTLFKSHRPAQLGKVFSLQDGKLHKVVAGNMMEGTYEVNTFNSPASLALLLQAVGTNQAISTSKPRTGTLTGRILVESKAMEAGVLARTQKDFPLSSGPGILTLDYDPPKDSAVLTRDELWATLLELVPAAANSGAVWWSSGSSHIHGPEGELQGLRGQRLYILIQDVADTVRAGAVLRDLCWLHELGRVEISMSGSKLMRSLWDEAMHQPARLDFIGGAVCQAPLSQQRGEPVLLGGAEWLDTRTALPDLSETQRQQLEAIQRHARDRVEVESLQTRSIWAAGRVRTESTRLQKSKGISEVAAQEQAKRIVEAALGGTLHGDYALPLPEGRYITVREVLDNWQQWDKQKTLDPLEPEHRGGEACGILYLSGYEPRLYSLAHGGLTFRLARQPAKVLLQAGKQSAVADELAQALSAQGDIFYSGGADLVQALPGKFVVLDRPTVQYLLGHRVLLVGRKAEREAVLNVTAEMVALTCAALGQKPSQTPPTLESITGLPYATADGHEMLSAGYSERTGIYNTMQADATDVTETPTKANVLESLNTLWAPWSDYEWASPADRGGMLAAIFTAVLRPAMQTAPGFFFDAPVQGSGKTKAALALGALMIGTYAGVTPFVDSRNQEEEYSKSIISILRSDRRFWLIDNITGLFESAALAGLITSGKIQGRILGMSKEGNFSGRLMVCATGNNATLGSDLHRRFVCCRIDTGVERPTDISHCFEPAQLARDSRMQIAAAVLTVLRAYRQAAPVALVGGSDFNEWSALVREPIVWLQQQGYAVEAGIGELTDPAKAFGGGEANSDPAQEGLVQLLTGLSTYAKLPKKFSANDVFKAFQAGESRPLTSEALIREGVENLSNGRTVTARSVGFVLKNRRDRRAGNMRLRSMGKNSFGALWQVQKGEDFS